MTKRNILPALAALIAIIALLFFLPSRKEASGRTYQHNEGTIFGTMYHAKYLCDEDLRAEIEAALHEVDASLSMFNPQSTISRINRNETCQADEMLSEVLQLSYRISTATGGAFDPTVAPLVNAWGFGFKHEQMPTRRQVDSLLKIRNQLDYSAIAKGYGSDVVAQLLQKKGVQNFMVEIGGEVVTKGISEKRLPWRIGVTKPVDDSLTVQGELQTILNVTDRAMATSGNYRNFYYKGGRKFAHTIDPKTGYPVQHSLLSATVLAADCATADAYATAFMVLGIERAKAVLERHPELMAYFIYSDERGQNAVWYSPSLRDKIAE